MINQALRQTTVTPATQVESVSGVLVGATSQLDELEKRLNGLRDRLQSRANQPAPMPAQQQVDVPAGLVGHAMSVRNAASRMLNLTDEILELL